MIHELHDLLARAAKRARSLRLWSSLAVCWLFWAAVMLAVARLAADAAWHWPTAWAVLAGATLLTAGVCWRNARRVAEDRRAVARRIEAAHPELGAMLLAALEQAPVARFKRLGYLQSTVVEGAVAHGRQHDWADATPIGRVRLAKLASAAALVALVSTAAMLVDRTGAHARSGRPTGWLDAARIGTDLTVEVQPGDIEIERGSTLVVIAKFPGAIPADADLVASQIGDAPNRGKPVAGEGVRAMARSLDDPQFVGRVGAVTADFDYFVTFAGGRSTTYRATVFEYPELVRCDALLKFPDYMRQEPKVIEDVRQLTAVEGAALTLTCRLNKDVREARLVDRDGEALELVRVPGNAPDYRTQLTAEKTRRFKLHLIDRQDRNNKLPTEIVVNVVPNRPPTIKVIRPGRDVRVSPLEELRIAAEMSDDFGLLGAGLSYALAGRAAQEVVLPGERQSGHKPEIYTAPAKTQALAEDIDFEALGAQPDELVSFHVWAEDMGPDGMRRRTASDIYFAEVRHFEEIFRQGEPMQGQPSQGQPGEDLAELQKQIAAATWKLIGRESARKLTPAFADDVQTLAQSQQQAIDQADALAGQLQDEQARAILKAARQSMDSALAELTKASDEESAAALNPALVAEQTAYQTLLKLRSRQFDVTRSQSSQGGQPRGSSSQRQLNELELSNNENRYETRSRATSGQDENARQLDESRRTLNRLRELARRQQDLNDRLRELQSSLQSARSAEERREIERQLKRLRDQQREILRDAESLQNDMQSAENRDQLQSQQEQLGQTRERAQQAADALDQGQLSQAITEGARAENQLSQLRDEFRQRTADRFTDEMRELRKSARTLDQRQQELSQQISEIGAGGRRSLRAPDERQSLADGLQQQQRELGETLERMRATTTEAEDSEPLLARELYDAVQAADRARTEQALDAARQLADAGANRDAAEAMRQADRGVRQLRERVERAAESVLGNETEALRRAADQLRELGDAIDREIARGQGRPSPQNRADAESSPSDQQPLDGRSPGGNPEQGRASEAAENQPRTESASQRSDQNQSASPAAGSGQAPGQGENQSATGASDRAANQAAEAGRGLRDERGGGGPAGNGRGGPGGVEQLQNLEQLLREADQSRGPITGDDFRGWSDRMRDVQDMLEDPELGAEVARIRDRAEQARAEFKRLAEPPDWRKLTDLIAEPLAQLQQRVADEIRRRESPDALAPIDRDAAPAEFADQIRLYYEQLGSGR